MDATKMPCVVAQLAGVAGATKSLKIDFLKEIKVGGASPKRKPGRPGMASVLAGDDLARSSGSRRMSWHSGSHRTWGSVSFRDSFREGWGTPLHRAGGREDDEEELRWAAIERLPTYDRVRKGVLKQVLDNGKVVQAEVDVTNLGMQDRKLLMENILKVVEEDNEKLLRRLRNRTDRVGIEIPTIEVRYENLSVEGDVYVGSRALPTLLNATLNAIESILGWIRLSPSKKRKIQILKDVSGIVKPSRMTLLLGPPAAGKTTLLLALAGKLHKDLRTSGKVTYCGHEFHEFVPQRTSAYISQHDLHYGEMTVRETLDFSARCLGVGTRYEMMVELSRREKDAGIKPDPEIDAFMKATAVPGQESSLETDYILKYQLHQSSVLYNVLYLKFFRQFLAFFGIHQMALSLFRFIAAVGRTQVVANTLGTFTLLLVFVLGGFIVAKDDIEPWMIWGYYISPMMYGQNAIVMNEFLDKRWSARNTDPRFDEPTVGKVLLKSRGFFTEDYWFWICIGALLGFSLVFNILFVGALTYLNPLGDSKAIIVDEDEKMKRRGSSRQETEGTEMGTAGNTANRGMVLPFQPLSLAFNHINYYVDMPAMFVEEVMELIELNPLRHALVGLPGVDGLSTEQRKRLTIAVELVANPSIIFMDEPTSGLDARAAAIVMRTVRNTVDTGRTVVCTIHQPSIDIFEAFDELLLMKRGGQVIYAGSLGRHSQKLIEYFEAVPGVPKIQDGYNPATWMLEISSPAMESQLDVDFAETYANSPLYQRNQELIEELSTPPLGSKDLHFPTQYSQPFVTQCKACFWKQHWSYWRNPQYNAIRFLMTFVIGILFGLIFWKKGQQTSKMQDLLNLFGAMYAAVLFLGATNAAAVQSIVAIERTVFYRERAAGMYSPLPYAFAQVAIETIYVAIQTIFYALILFSMVGFKWSVAKFLWFWYFILMSFIYFTLYGMMVVAMTPAPQIGAILMSFFLSFWNLFSGFMIPRTQLPIWWRWYYWCSPVAWTLYGLVTSQVGDKSSNVGVPGSGNVPLKVFLKQYLGFEYDFLPAVAAAHIGWVVLFFFVFAYCIKFLNFQRR
ncbi:hypothetical protein Tsubulata_003348 [Turnera subulata]|uniref:ABC transporter domain-containing protein n=1 Tax=Turnera subulata TaxID=218843 RepID=A0A9Q0GCN8_9ROSI|nr:hypothetical protein Tsubulata_003348 [Turnera subulata]